MFQLFYLSSHRKRISADAISQIPLAHNAYWRPVADHFLVTINSGRPEKLIMDSAQLYSQFETRMREIADLSNAASVLQWDHEVYLPAAGGADRARQVATLSGIIFEKQTAEPFISLLKNLSATESLTWEQKTNVAVTRRHISRKQKLDKNFVEQLSNATSNGYEAWISARKSNDFSVFAPWLEKIVALKKEEAERTGSWDHPYDALLDEFEPGMKTSTLEKLFGEIKPGLESLIKRIEKALQTDDSFMHGFFEKEKQWNSGLDVLKLIGFDFSSGRQDISAHPFTISLGSKDIRLTTRINEENFHEMLWSCFHEGGHGLYEQGLDKDSCGLPKAEAASLGIHESQSRLWENHIGRGRPFWNYYYPILQKTFPEQFENVSADDFYRAINKVKPSLIRTNADELTYHFHVIIRFEIERELIAGKLSVNEVPQRWNSLCRQYLGIDVPDDASGVLQDIHWSHGSFGYFPTYSLGSFYAAQFYQKAKNDIPDLEAMMSKGDSKPLLDWLRSKIHSQGKLYNSEDLCRKVTSESLNIKYFQEYAEKKYEAIYKL